MVFVDEAINPEIFNWINFDRIAQSGKSGMSFRFFNLTNTTLVIIIVWYGRKVGRWSWDAGRLKRR
jgi:hypothetical protein